MESSMRASHFSVGYAKHRLTENVQLPRGGQGIF
jgi:hypothetical protein